MTDRERAIARLYAAALVAEALRRKSLEVSPIAIHPTMRPDPQAAIATHGTLMSHARA